jgi:hypothetical protein
MTMLIRLDDNGLPIEHPILEENFRLFYTGLPPMLTREVAEALGFGLYDFSAKPSYAWNQSLKEVSPVRDENGIFRQTWEVTDLEGEDLVKAKAMIKNNCRIEILGLTERRLDEFARTKDYLSCIHAISYVSSSNTAYSAEARYMSDIRDITWSKVYDLLNEIDTGKRSFLTSFYDIKDELPELNWPNT